MPPARSHELQTFVAPGDNYADDTLVQVGLRRFTHYRQAPEISLELLKWPFCIAVPDSSVNYLARKFVAYFQIVHEESVGLLRSDMRKRGGYILHIDGTCDKGSRVLLVCVDSLSGQVLDSRKIGSENHEEVLGILKAMRKNWGIPMAVVHDLRKAFFSAASKAFPGVPQFACHFHFVADVGKDILSVHQSELRTLFRREKIKPKLRELVRSLKTFAVSKDSQEHVVNSIVNQRSKPLSKKKHKAILKKLRTSLLKHARKDEKKKRACDIVVTHLDKYWNYLYGHTLKKGAQKTVVPRTNNFVEGLFGIVSRQCRRLHGRGHIGRDLETMPASTPLILNLNNTSYCETVYGGKSPEKIAERFSKVDPKHVTNLMKTWQGDTLSSKLPRKLEQLKSLPRQVSRFLSVAAQTLR